MAVVIRPATLADLPGWMACWSSYLAESHAAGNFMPPCRENILEGERLLRAYLWGSLFGVAPIALDGDDVVGAMLVGEDWGTPRWVSDLGRTATVWFVYVNPTHRRRGVSYQLHLEARKSLREMGFKHGVSQVRADNPTAVANALRWGATQTHWTVVSRLEDNP